MPGNPLLKTKTDNMSGSNPDGNNGVDNGIFTQLVHYRLEEDNSSGSEATLYKLQKHFNTPSARRTSKMPAELVDQLVLNKMSDINDHDQKWGVGRTMDVLAKDNTPVPRSIVRQVKQQNEPLAVDARFPGRKKIPRGHLKCIGPFYEVNCDGHEKLGSLALKMGPVELPIYGMKDKWSSAILHLVVVPNDRLETTIGHVYLDFVESFGAIPIQITVDKGSETGYMRQFQLELRKLFNWLWPPIIQYELDEFRDSWNKHKIRRQPKKRMPSGNTPSMFFRCPELFKGIRSGAQARKEDVNALRTRIPVSREDAFRWVDSNFAMVVGAIYEGNNSVEILD
ncbi:hypothetical protein PHLCEN_2v25 [Hermanssonia centrifuga]|uniref:Integrase catalytic domain-containing protein n=1 Tax=Hermanssonia centrifuga TaxID=98765 RepID=A0A2R6S748_9APHY|nr:hypothetical protein PHLCEN_2v25 [Hermanssonia centrifuga]